MSAGYCEHKPQVLKERKMFPSSADKGRQISVSSKPAYLYKVFPRQTHYVESLIKQKQ